MSKKKKKGKGKGKDPFYKNARVYGSSGYETSTDTGWGWSSHFEGGGGHGGDYAPSHGVGPGKPAVKKGVSAPTSPAPKKGK